MSGMFLITDEKIKEQLEQLARVTGKPVKKLAVEVLEKGLKTYQEKKPSAAKALLDLADYAEKIGAKAPADLSTNHDKYLYDE